MRDGISMSSTGVVELFGEKYILSWTGWEGSDERIVDVLNAMTDFNDFNIGETDALQQQADKLADRLVNKTKGEL